MQDTTNKVEQELKQCSRCKAVLPLSGFVKDRRKKLGVTSDCKSCRRIRSRQWTRNNPERVAELNRKPEAKRARKEWWEKNKERVKAERRAKAATPEGRAKNAARARKYRQENKEYRIKSNLRGRINYALNGRRRTESVETIIGCSILYFVSYLESKFEPGMSWDNYGDIETGWHIDHIKPCASFDLTDPEEQRACFHYSNCQPLWAKDNLSKGAKLF